METGKWRLPASTQRSFYVEVGSIKKSSKSRKSVFVHTIYELSRKTKRLCRRKRIELKCRTVMVKVIFILEF